MLLEIIIFLLSILVFKAVLDHIFRPRNLPPGPSTLPFLGNLHQLGSPEESPITFMNLGKRYGPVFTIFVGSKLHIVINSIEAAKEALISKGNIFAGRPPLYVLNAILRGCKDFSFRPYDTAYKTHRKRIVHSALKTHGEGRLEVQQNICEEIDALYTRLDAFNGSPVDPKSEMLLTVMNVICVLIVGSRYEMDHPDVLKIEENFDRENYILSCGNVLNSFPILRYLPLTINKKIEEFNTVVEEVLGRRYREHLQTFQDGHIRDYTDALIQAAKDAEEKGDLEAQALTEDNIVMILLNLISAGTETVSTTLRWLLLYMVAYPEVQAKVHEELDRVVGPDRLPELCDRDNLVYLRAVIEEILRFVTIVPINLPHCTTADTSVNGYSIPKDTIVIFNLFGINHDPNKWENPDEFDPSRFIDQDNKLKQTADLSFLSFSAGRRGCVGEAFARVELFLIFSRLMHRYRVEKPPGAAPPDLEGITRFLIAPKYYEICFLRRE